MPEPPELSLRQLKALWEERPDGLATQPQVAPVAGPNLN
jgi:hypothetical protein